MTPRVASVGGASHTPAVRALFLPVLLTAAVGAGCKQRDRQPEVVRDVEQLSHDQCLEERLTESERKRVVAAARAGRITIKELDAYVGEILETRKRIRGSNVSVDSFCQLQLNIWRRHFGR